MSSAPGVLKTTCVPLNCDRCHAGKASGHRPGAWPSGSRAALALGARGWVELPLLVPRWPSPTLSPAGPVGTRAALSAARQSAPPVHGGASLCPFPLYIRPWTAVVPWERVQGTANSEPSGEGSPLGKGVLHAGSRKVTQHLIRMEAWSLPLFILYGTTFQPLWAPWV